MYPARRHQWIRPRKAWIRMRENAQADVRRARFGHGERPAASTTADYGLLLVEQDEAQKFDEHYVATARRVARGRPIQAGLLDLSLRRPRRCRPATRASAWLPASRRRI